ncbi:MAG TPA: isoprenylcysteine carboxylmethyltransferase family protein [Acidobacteriaceae bacterium]|jgi:protein-S-isoprenylcysteine O-methyltransferase Ste14|nr:isoprenylcysteine carboxylmethyltransferase family protein [Acidobacteriaceae bacterium]
MLWLRGIVFSVLVPGLVAFFVPQWLPHGPLAGGWSSLGWLILFAGGVLYARCLVDFLVAGGTPAIYFTRPLRGVLGEEPQRLVHTGLYRYSRNPMYVGVFLVIAGQACLFRSRAIGLYLGAAMIFFHCVVIFLEEPHLARARGVAYDEYRRHVPRWIGIPRA